MIDFKNCEITEMQFEKIISPEPPPYPHLWRVHSLGATCINFEAWRIVKETPAGCWVTDSAGVMRKLVIHSHVKRWAYPTKREAWIAWKFRLKSRRRYAEEELDRVAELEKLAAANDSKFMGEKE